MIGQRELMEQLKTGRILSAGKLAELLDCSEKTVRTAVSELRDDLKGADIISVKGKGYRLQINDEQVFAEWKKQRHLKESEYPQTKEERARYILKALLFAKGYIRRQTFATQLYVSEKTITADLKEVSRMLEPYHLVIRHIPSHGMKITGSEFSIRQCMLNCAVSPLDAKDERVKAAVDRITEQAMRQNSLSVPVYLLESLRDYLAISVKRLQEGCFIDDHETAAWPRNVGIFYMANTLVDAMVQEKLIEAYTESEVYYVSLYLWGNRFLPEFLENVRSYVIPRHTRQWAAQITQILKGSYGCEGTEEEAFQKCLLNHTSSVEIRMKYNIHITHPEKDKIRLKFPYAWHAAAEVIQVLEQALSVPASADEISFYALLIRGILPQENIRLNVRYIGNQELIEDYYLRTRLKQEFQQYLKLCDPEDAAEYDLIITTMDSVMDPGIPVIRLNYPDCMENWAELRSTILKHIQIKKEKQNNIF